MYQQILVELEQLEWGHVEGNSEIALWDTKTVIKSDMEIIMAATRAIGQ